MFGPRRKESYQPLDMGDMAYYEENDHEEWLRRREHGPHWNNPDLTDPYYFDLAFGASSISSIFNKSPWVCSLELFHKKIGITPSLSKEFNKAAKKLGHIYEAAISEAFMLYMEIKYPFLKIEKGMPAGDGTMLDKHMFRHGKRKNDGSLKYPWAVVNLDYLIKVSGQLGILEIKRMTDQGKYAMVTIKNWKNGIVPPYYDLQCRYQMATMNLQFCYICCSWGHRLDQMAVVRIDRDYEIENYLMETIAEFAEYCEYGVEPPLDMCNPSVLNEYYYRLYGEVDPLLPTIELPDTYKFIIQESILLDKKTAALNEKLELLDIEKEEIYSKLYPAFGKSTYGICRLDNNQVIGIKLKTPMKKAKIDVERLEKEHPEMLKKYTKFDETTFKEEEPRLKLEYLLPREPSDDPKSKNTFSTVIYDT